MRALDSPLYCLTCDVDWASEYAIHDFLALAAGYGIRPTVFATHRSPVIAEFHRRGQLELGIHPNFLPGSSHGHDVHSVVERLCNDFPEARTFRSHCFYDNTHITRELARRGFRYDSNLCLYFQRDLVPLNHQSGITRYPVFWEDDVHWSKPERDWDPNSYLDEFASPGLKILNVHPFFVCANIPTQTYYEQIKPHISTLDAVSIDRIRYPGDGTRSFLIGLLDSLTSRGERFYTLGEVHQMCQRATRHAHVTL